MTDWHFKYWKEATSCALEEIGLELNNESLEIVANNLMLSAELEDESTGQLCIPNPLLTEIENLKKKHKKEIERIEEVEEVYKKHIMSVHNVESHHIQVKYGQLWIE